ncbi:MAG: hypothetical protein HY429_01605 [Candidatus Levybacteria bacterium]|nr:hypothetical protein [Candidatus Levybacteria bacterium]
MPEAKKQHPPHIPGLRCFECGQIEPIRVSETPEELKNISSSNCEKIPTEKLRDVSAVTLKNGETILPRLQDGKDNCGQTALSMLGYDKQEIETIIQGEERLSTHHVYLGLPKAKWIKEAQPESTADVMLSLVKMKTGSNHWILDVLGRDDKRQVICPANGVLSAEEYFTQRADAVLFEFAVPLRSQVGLQMQRDA